MAGAGVGAERNWVVFGGGTVMTKLLTICGMWCVTDGWFSLSLYIRDKNQSWHKDHYIRVIRIIIGLVLIWVA